MRDALVSVAGPSAMAYLPQALALAVVVEFAPLCSALILAGRSGASLAAEIGSMKQTEQIDALTLLGIRPMQALMAPRILACVISLPILTVFTAYLAIYSGFLTESLTGSMSFSQYQSEVLRVLTLRESLPALGKTVFRARNWYFGLLLRHGNRRRNRRRGQSCNPGCCQLHRLGSYSECISCQNHPVLFQLMVSNNHKVQPFRYSLNRNLSASLFPVVPLASSQLIFAPLRSETLPSNTVSASAPL